MESSERHLIEEKLVALLREAIADKNFKDLAPALIKERSLNSLDMDSLEQVEFVMQVEQSYDFEFAPHELNGVETVVQLAGLVEAHLSNH